MYIFAFVSYEKWKKIVISCNLFHYSRVLLNILQNIYDYE